MQERLNKKAYLDNPQNMQTALHVCRAVSSFTGDNLLPSLIAFYALRQLRFHGIEAASLSGDFLKDYARAADPAALAERFAALHAVNFDYGSGEDVLGFLYMALSPLRKRKRFGVYYTQSRIAREMLAGLSLENKTILDPCCGTGVFLLEAARRGADFARVYGRDIDPVAVFIARVNMVSLCGQKSLAGVLRTVTCADSLLDGSLEKFSLIIGNPPWGGRFDKTQSLILQKRFALAPAKGKIESFKLFVERGLELLEDGGTLSFLLPESFFTIKLHETARRFLLDSAAITAVRYWGNIFSGVLCPSLTMTCVKGLPQQVVAVRRPDCSYEVPAPGGEKVFSFHTTDASSRAIRAVYESRPYVTLKNNVRFGLGIVTGNNKKFILTAPCEGGEPVYKGRDVEPFFLREAANFIVFKPELYQQVAPRELYRQAKIVYRFIGTSLVCVYDEAGSLLLNSANFFVPGVFYPPQVIACLFNSRLYSFLYRNLFATAKVLRSHLESLPLPLLTDAETALFCRLHAEMRHSYDAELLDRQVKKLFNLKMDSYM